MDKIEALVNEEILKNVPVTIEEMALDAAKEKGAMALFGEKYGDVVRVVSVDDFSCELCGGSHVANTSVIGSFRITSETGTGSGVRRIEAVTGPAALKLAKDESQELQQLAGLLKAKVSDAPAKLEALLAQLKDTEKELAQLKKDAALSDMDSILAAKEDIGGVPVVAASAQADSMDNLRDLADTVLDKLGSGVVLLGMTHGDKVNFVCKVAKGDTKKGLHAGKIIKQRLRLLVATAAAVPTWLRLAAKNRKNWQKPESRRPGRKRYFSIDFWQSCQSNKKGCE